MRGGTKGSKQIMSTTTEKPIEWPTVIPREPYDDRFPTGYLEGDRDYTAKNMDAAVWFLDNAERLKAENKRLREALEFYANRENWKEQETGIGMAPSEAEDDYGSKARAALKP